jgi:hypothetical protein
MVPGRPESGPVDPTYDDDDDDDNDDHVYLIKLQHGSGL